MNKGMVQVIFTLDTQVFMQSNNVYVNLKDQIKVCVYIKPKAIHMLYTMVIIYIYVG